MGTAPISVVIPAFRNTLFLDRALRSIYRQTHPVAEIVVVDDASNNGLSEFVRSKHPRVRLVTLSHNVGPSRARNVGVSYTNQPLVAFLDHDDEYTPAFSETAAKVFSASGQSIDLLLTGYEVRDSSGESRFCHACPEGESFLARAARVRNCYTMSQMVVRADSWRRFGGLNPALRIAHDLDFVLRLAPHAAVQAIPDPLVIKHQHGENLSGDSDATTLEVASVVSSFYSTLRVHGLSTPRRDAAFHFAGAGGWYILRHKKVSLGVTLLRTGLRIHTLSALLSIGVHSGRRVARAARRFVAMCVH